jgi:hypothetical protein
MARTKITRGKTKAEIVVAVGKPPRLDGDKHDGGKLRLELVPPEFEAMLAEIFEHGAHEYGEGNWRLGFEYNRLIGAALRHLNALRRGQDVDPESGLPHAVHASWNLLTLSYQQYYGLGLDDRVFEKDDEEDNDD